MAKLHITTLAASLVALGTALAQDPAPIPPPAPITPLSSAPVTPEQPAPIEPPLTPETSSGTAAQSPDLTTTGTGATAPLATGTGGATAPVATGTSGPAVLPVTHSVNEFQGDDINQVFRLLARQAKISLIISDKVAGTVTVRLENKTPLEAIEIIANSKNLILEEQKDVYYIKTQEEKAKEPAISANYTFSYAQANTVAPLLAGQLQSGVPPQIDTRTNTVFYRETKSNMDNIKLFLATVDQPTRQVMIEARLVEVTANPQQSYGINWAGVVGSAGSPQVVSYGATTNQGGSSSSSTGGSSSSSSSSSSTQTPIGPFALGNGASTNFLNSLTHLGQLATGQIAILSVPQMSLAMQFLNEDSDAQFLANPRIVTANNQKAVIQITRNQPVPELQFNSQTATAQFSGFQDKTYGNTLTVTPSINKDNFVTLAVKPEISNKVADASFTFEGATVVSPIIDTRTLDSNVLIKSGDTLAIGGLLQDELTKTSNKVPVFGDIPVVGYVFQSHQNVRTKRNLLVFVTPTIINQGYGTGLEDQVSGLNYSGDEFADPNGWRNNAKGNWRLKPTSNRQIAADYPKPGVPPSPSTSGSSSDDSYSAQGTDPKPQQDPVNYKVSTPGRGD